MPSDAHPVAAALREAEEEVGLPASRVDIVGRLDTYVTGTGFEIVPVVALVRPPYPLRPDPFEVAEVFEACGEPGAGEVADEQDGAGAAVGGGREDVVDLEVDGVQDPQTVKMRRILACSGDWVQVEIALVKGMKPLLKTDAPAGAVRGWANGTCTAQLTTCDFRGDTPWSPPAPLPTE